VTPIVLVGGEARPDKLDRLGDELRTRLEWM
jgi:hypothetical protein